jgi:trimethylamine corrinoid protein
MGDILSDLKQAIIDLDQNQARELADRVVAGQVDFLKALESCGDGLQHIGSQFESGEIYLPELMKSGQVMQEVLNILEPEMMKKGERKQTLGRVVIGTVQGDMHDIGKNIVATMFTINGFEVFDIGKDVTISRFLEEARNQEAHIVAASAMLTTTMAYQRDLVDAIAEEGLKEKVKVLVGGAPVSRQWADSIGADGFGINAIDGVKTARKLLGRHD